MPEQRGRQIFGAPEGQDARLLADRAHEAAKTRNVVCHIASDDMRAHALCELVAFFAPEVEIVYFPAWDCLPYDRVSPNAEIVAQRVAALSRLIEWRKSDKFLPRIVITTINAAMQRTTPVKSLDNSGFAVKVGARVVVTNLQDYLVQNGYTRTDTVREHGEFAIRGGIIDLFAPTQELPVRIDLFGDEVESIRTFDAATQRTEGKLEFFSLRPVTEFFLDSESIQRFRAGYRESFGAVTNADPLYEAVSEGRRYNGMDHWLPLFFERLDTIFDYMPDMRVSMDQHAGQAAESRLAQVKDFYEARQTLAESFKKKGKKKDSDVSLTGTVYHALSPARLYVSEGEWERISAQADTVLPFGAPETDTGIEDASARKGRDFGDIRALPEGDVFGALKSHMAVLASQGKKIVIACYSEGSRDRLKGMMDHAIIQTKHEMVILGLEHGFVADDLAVLTEQDILGDRLTRRTRKENPIIFLPKYPRLTKVIWLYTTITA
jgi:transcription-repair coupling factor (superfamily II helicase)